MALFGVNLKRFDVGSFFGGICQEPDVDEWIQKIIAICIESGIGAGEHPVILFPPEIALVPALRALRRYPVEKRNSLSVGSQGVYREDISIARNFGAFTTNLPAAAVISAGATHTLIGHSEERRGITGILTVYDSDLHHDASTALNTILQDELLCALRRNLRVVFCVGETQEEQGGGAFDEKQKDRIRDVLSTQIDGVLHQPEVIERSSLIDAVAYEPRWAIGPGRTPPGPAYIEFVIEALCDRLTGIFGVAPPILYGGGLKRENAATIGAVPRIGGGLVALTRFTSPPAFDPVELGAIMSLFVDQPERGE